MQTLLTLPSNLGYGYIQLEQSMVGLESKYGDYLFTSHAHSDHTKKLKTRKLISSNFTSEIIYNKQPDPPPKGITLYNAGHIIGSKQITINTEQGRIGYTGDLRLSPRFGIKGAEIIDCDYLIIESTYARSTHPPYEEVYESFRKCLKNKGIKIIAAYEVGKAQEITKILNEEGITPIVTEKINRLNQYDNLDQVVAGSDESKDMLKGEYVAILPPKKVNREFATNLSVALNEKVLTIGVTAQPWALWKYDYAFAISDHSDQRELIEYVEQVNPEMILTTHGDDIYFANLLRSKGYNSIPYSKLKRGYTKKK